MQANERINQRKRQGGGVSRVTLALIGFVAVAAYFLFSEHRAHFIAFLPYLLLAACPLMHLFHGHGRHGGQTNRPDDRSRGTQAGPERAHRH